MDNTSFSSVFELDQNQIHNFEAGEKGGTDVDYSHASKCEQNDEHNKPQPHVDYPYASNGEKPQHDQSQPHPDQQLPPQPPEAPQRPPGQPVQYPPQGNRPMYEARPAGHVHFAPQSPQINFVFENGPNPTQFPPQSPQSQPVPIHNVQMAQPAQFSQVHYHQANPVYTNGPHQPAAAYPQGTQARSIHPPGPAQSMGPPPGASPRHPAGYQSAPSPVKFPPENGGVLGGFGHDTPDHSGSAGYANRPASGFPVQHPGRVPVMVLQQQVPTEGWKTGLFDCMDDPNNALVTAFCPCITFGQIAEIVDNGNTPCTTSGLLYGLIVFLIAMPCVMSCTYRTKLRSRFGLVESPAPDWVTHFLCECCAICQEYRELQHRGLDPSIGWQGNVARIQAGLHQQQQVNMMPPVNQRMMA